MRSRHRTTVDNSLLYQWGNEKLTTQQQEKFVSQFKGVPGKVLEIGCGHGVMLDLFKKAGITAYGLDLSEPAVEISLKKGLEAVHSDVLSHLGSLPDSSLGGIFCAHVIEHLVPSDALTLITESYRVLKRKGKIIFITPNAKDLRTTERFWLDITHVRPYPEKLIRVLLTKQGFTSIETFCNAEPATNALERIVKTVMRLWFLGYLFTGDLVVIAQK
ncbi:MAG: class I SAM-dependent methyltransferase [Ignavibacteriae bacterium]|nr:class I SAM-dependent methyltransferase [Ignavibacteriota bacterium]